MKTKRRLLYFLLYLLFCSTLQAQQNPQPHFRNYSTEHGLPSPEVYCVIEDSKGYMWFGTDNGVVRFDGYEFKNFGAEEGLLDNVVFEILEDSKGRIWISTMSGNIFILENNQVVPYEYNDIILKYKSRFGRGAIANITENQTAYIELTELGFLKIDHTGKDSLITSIKPCVRFIYSQPGLKKINSTYINRREEEDYNKMYLDTYNTGYVNIESRLGKNILEFKIKEKPNAYELIGFAGTLLSGNRILCYLSGELVYFIDNKITKQIPYDKNVEEIKIDNQGGLWFCLINQGGLRYYKNLDAVFRGAYESYLPNQTITNFYQDSHDGIWITTHDAGIYYCNKIDLITFDQSFGLSSDIVTTSTIKNETELFLGLENGDIFHIDYTSNKILNSFPNIFGTKNFDLFYNSEKDRLYTNGGYFKNNKWQGLHYLSTDGISMRLKTRKFHHQHLNKKKQLIACSNSGFYIFGIDNDSIQLHSSNIKGYNRQRITSVFSDQNGQLWIGTGQGIFQFQDSVVIQPEVSHPAFHNRVEDIDELSDGSLVFGTKGYGVIVWKKDSILQLTTKDGLTSNMLEEVVVDQNGILWAGTLNGLNKITFQENRNPLIRTFTTFNGLPSNEINQIRTYQGQLWLSTSKGLVKFNEGAKNETSLVPTVQWVKINNQTIDVASTDFTYNQNNFEFRYLTINYRMNGKISYRYRIQEDAPWQYTQNLNVNYPSLTPNDYTFEVQAQNEDGYWSESTIYQFAVQPPFWATWWFRLLGILLFSGAGFAFYKNRTNQLRRENDLKTQMVVLEKSALQAQMNPHFIFNCLNSIQNFILKNDTKKAVEYLSRFARLVRHNLNASVQGEVSLEEEVSILDNYLALERERFEQRFDYQINVEPLLENQFIEFPPMLIQPYVENAVIHGLSEKEANGKVEIDFTRNNGNLMVTIKDNGIGYRQNENGQKSNRHKSVGMTITQKRLELLGENPNNVVQIETINNNEGKPKGTKVSIIIKIKNAQP